MSAPVSSVPAALDAVLAIDVGGTDIKSTLVTAHGDVAPVERRPTPHEPVALVDAIAGIAGAHTGLFAGVGVVVPGVVERDVALFSENLGWSDLPLGTLVRDRLGVPVAFGQDVRAAAAAELALGEAARFRDPVIVVIGTGLSCVVVRDGRMLSGSPLVGEIGHAPIGGDGADELCACGLTGCLESVASAASIARRYRRISGRAAAGARDVLARSLAGDGDAVRVWNTAVDGLAFGLTHVVAGIAPDAVLIAGGLSQAGDRLIEPLRERLARRLSFHRMPVVAAARLGDEAGVLGAALAARALLASARTTTTATGARTAPHAAPLAVSR